MNWKADRLRLLSLRERASLAGEQMDQERTRFDRLRTRHQDGTAPRPVIADQLFQTPPDIARRMVERARLNDGDRVLEPSAGLGRILDQIASYPVQLFEVVAVELSPDCCRELYHQRRAVTLRQGDFLALAPTLGRFDRIIMNPPFRRGTDCRHILAARQLLTAGGRLVALCYDGMRQRQKLKPLARTWEPLPSKSFAPEGTGADVVMLTMAAQQETVP